MNMPGFNAEASLYRTRRHYQMAGNPTQTDAAIYPARFRVRDAIKYLTWRSVWFDTYSCCLDCRRDCYAACSDSSCIQYCLDGCTSRCDAYWIGGCKRFWP